MVEGRYSSQIGLVFMQDEGVATFFFSAIFKISFLLQDLKILLYKNVFLFFMWLNHTSWDTWRFVITAVTTGTPAGVFILSSSWSFLTILVGNQNLCSKMLGLFFRLSLTRFVS